MEMEMEIHGNPPFPENLACLLRTLNNRPSAPPGLPTGTESQGTLNTNNQAQRYTSHMYQL